MKRSPAALTRAAAARWKLVNAAEAEELRRMPLELKLRQLAALMASARDMGWSRKLRAEDAAVRGRWTRLRKALGC